MLLILVENCQNKSNSHIDKYDRKIYWPMFRRIELNWIECCYLFSIYCLQLYKLLLYNKTDDDETCADVDFTLCAVCKKPQYFDFVYKSPQRTTTYACMHRTNNKALWASFRRILDTY